MNFWALRLAGASVASISAALMFFSGPEEIPDNIARTAYVPVSEMVQPATPEFPENLVFASASDILMITPVVSTAQPDTAPLVELAAVSDPEYVLCVVWFLGKVSDELRGVDVAEARSSHTVPLPGPIWLMQKLRSAAG